MVLGSAHGGDRSSFSQLGCCSRELRSRRFEEEEGQTGVAFITDAISPSSARYRVDSGDGGAGGE